MSAQVQDGVELGAVAKETQPTKQSFEVIDTDRYKRAISYQNPDIVERLVQKHGLSLRDAEQCFHDTKQFLYLCAVVPGSYCPTEVIDLGWHAFILFTREYASFCQDYLGRFMHHIPVTSKSEQDIGRPVRTLKAAVMLFGVEHLSSNWAFRSESNPDRVLSPNMIMDESWNDVLEMIDPCGDHCGCGAACTGAND